MVKRVYKIVLLVAYNKIIEVQKSQIIKSQKSQTYTCRGSFINSWDESICFFRSKSIYSKTRYNRLSLFTTSYNLSSTQPPCISW